MSTTLWATADLHFGHAKAIAFGDRPFKDVDDMNAGLIERWNDNVAPRDVVYLLGDVAFLSPSKTRQLVSQLHGSIVLVAGNHDNRKLLKLRRWAVVRYHISFHYAGFCIEMAHYPPALDMVNPLGMKTLWLHGHLHSKTPGPLPMYDVGVDANDWTPVRLDDIVAKARQREQSIINLKNVIGDRK